MKPFIIGIATILLSIMVMVFNQDYRINKRHSNDLKNVADEAAVSGALFTNLDDFKEGRIVFDRTEGIKALEYKIKKSLYLDDNFNPLDESYWTEKVTYNVYFFDDSNTTYPYQFVDSSTDYTFRVTQPTVIVTINAGKGRYRITAFKSSGSFTRSGAYEWKNRS
jgi:hypothetical protein